MAKPKKSLAKQVAEALPGVGTAMDVAEVGKSLAAGQYGKAAVDAGIALAGVTPIGRGITRLGKFAYDVFRKADDKDIALKMIKDKDARDNWVRGKQKELGIDPNDPDYGDMDLVPKAEIKRRQTRKFAEQVEQLEKDEITGTEYRRYIRENQPATTFNKEDLDTMIPTFEDLVGGLDVKNANKAASGVVGLDSTIEKGAEVTARLDIPAYNNRDIWVATLKKTKGTAEDKKSKYGRTAVLKDVEFYIEGKAPKKTANVMEIGKGKRQKTPFATMKGKWQDVSDEDAFEMAKKAIDDPSYIQVGFNPERHSFFYDKATMLPVFEATNIIQVGPLVLAKVPGVANSALVAKTLSKPERVKRIGQLRGLRVDTSGKGEFPGRPRTYKEGGVVPMQEQMKFAFMNEGGVLADDGVDRDPVSGNEVPSGSMAEEVRDDVPAMLSEGEYVVPADVVRYHGIDKFEELRDEAKRGLARMEADGRIGGQPVEEQEEFPFLVEELEGFQEGGAVGDVYEDVMGQPYIPPQDQESSYVARGRFPGTGFELRNFTNPRTGRTVVIPFFNGKPMQYIPPDFLEGGASTQQTGTFDPAADDRDRQEREAERARTPTDSAFPLPSGFPQDTQAGPRSFAEYTPEDWSRYISQTDSTLADITAKVPVLGFIQRMNENAARNYAESALRSGKNPATGQELTLTEKNALGRVLATSRNTGIIEAVKNYITGARGSTTGVPLFEQADFEKDLLPFEPKLQDTAPQTVDSDLEEFNKRYGSVEESDLEDLEQIATDTNQYLDQTQQVAFAPERSFAELEQTFQPDREGREFVWTVLPGRFGNAQRKVRVEDAYLLGTNALANIDTGNVQGMMPRVTSTGDDDAPVLSASVLKRNIRGEIPKARDVQEEIKANIEANRFQPRQAGILENLFGFAGPAYGAPEFTDSGVLANDAYRDMSNFEKKYVNLATSMGYVGSLDAMIAKMRHETNKGENENLYQYTSKNLLDTFGAIRTSGEAVELVAKANQAYNRTGNMQDYKFVVAEGVYGMNTPVGKRDLNNTQPFDGAVFTGRSQSQTTGRHNYTGVSQILYNNFPEQFTRPDFLTTLTQSEFDFYSQGVPTNMSQQERYARALDNKLDDIVADPDKALKFNVAYAIHHQNENPNTVSNPVEVINKYGGSAKSKALALKELEKIRSKGGLQTKVTLDPSKLKEEVGKGAIKVTKPPLKKPEEIDYIAPMPGVNFAEYEQDRQISAPEPLVGAELFRERERQRAEMQGGLRSQPIAQPTEEATPDFIDPIRKIASDKEERDALIKGGQRLASLDDQMQDIQRDISPVQDVEPPTTGERKVTDARAFLQGRDAAKKAVEDAISFAPKTEPKEQPREKPKEQPRAEPTQLEKTRAKQAMGAGKSREEARQEADKVLQQTGDAFAADRAYHEAFTGFTSSGELSPSFGFKEGGLASRPKKTKSKKRNTKKGLGARMAT